MSTPVFINNYSVTLAAAITSTATTIIVSSATGLPTLSAGEILPITLLDAATKSVYEIVYATAISGTSLTVLRGQEGTVASAYAAGDFAMCNFTAFTVMSTSPANPVDFTELITFSNGNYATRFLITINTTLGSSQLGQPLLASGTITLTLPAAATFAGGSYKITNTGTGVITIAGSTNIGPSSLSSVTLSQKGQTVILTSDGTTWWRTEGSYDITRIEMQFTASAFPASGCVAAYCNYFATIETGTGFQIINNLNEYNEITGAFIPLESGYYLIGASASQLTSGGGLIINLWETAINTGTQIIGNIAEGTATQGASGARIYYLTAGTTYYLAYNQGVAGGLEHEPHLSIARILP